MLLGLALMLLVLPLRWVIAVFVAAIWHELCHFLAVLLCGGAFQRVRVGVEGAVVECAPMGLCREVLSILAGPLGSLLLVCFAAWFPQVALCGFVHGLYNLIPVYPLDGGRVLRTAAFVLLPVERAENVCAIVVHSVKALAVALAVIGTFVLDLGFLPLLTAGFLLFRMKREKLLANFRDRGYNRATIVTR